MYPSRYLHEGGNGQRGQSLSSLKPDYGGVGWDLTSELIDFI